MYAVAGTLVWLLLTSRIDSITFLKLNLLLKVVFMLKKSINISSYSMAILAILVLVSACGGTSQQPFSIGEPYVRDDSSNRKVMASAKTFKRVDGKGPKITLFGVAHIAEKDFYQKVNERLARADVILYEGVMPTEPLKLLLPSCRKLGSIGNHSLTASSLGLASQSNEVIMPEGKSIPTDTSLEAMIENALYSQEGQQVLSGRGHPQKKSFFDSQRCYAALHIIEESLMERVQILKKRGEIDWSYQLPDFIHGSSDMPELSLVMVNGSRLKPREALTKSIENFFENAGPASMAIEKALVDFRNEVPLKELGKHLDYSSDKEIVVLFGAAHMPHMESELMKRYSYVPDYEERHTLWTY